MFYWTITVTFLLLMLSFASFLLKRSRTRHLLEMFRAYNEGGEKLEIITQWIEDRHSALRLLSVLEYLDKIEEDELACKVFLALPYDAYPARAIRILAVKALRICGKDEALDLCKRMYEDHPKDDSILEIYVDTHIAFERFQDAEAALTPRLEKPIKGTVFSRQQAQLLAHKGELDKALEIMDKVVNRDFMLYKNTMASTHKKLIYDQYITSQTLFDELREKAGLAPKTPEEKKA